MQRYELLDYTADIGIKIYGRSLPEVFENAAFGMFDIITDLGKVGLDMCIEIQQQASEQEELLVAWLRELLYRYNSKEMLFKDFDIEELSENRIEAKAWGERLDRKKHELKTEIKAVTYHDLKIEETNSGWTARVVFDV